MTGFDAPETRHYEGWDDRDTNPDEVRRFAVPPYQWVVVPKSRFPAKWERENPEEFARRCSSA